MKFILKMKTIFILLISFSYYCQSVPQKKVKANLVIATGVGQIFNNQIGRAKDDALIDAKKVAVQQVLGSLVKGKSASESGVLSYSSLVSKTEGFIEKFEVIEMRAISKFEYQVTIKAKVNKAKLQNVIEETLAMRGQPRMMFLLHEVFIDGSLTNYNSDALEERFIAKGFPVVDKNLAHKIIKEEKQKLVGILSASKLKKIKVDSGAEVLLIGTATIKNAGKVMNTRMNSIQITVSVKAVDANTAKILASAQATSASVHINEATGAVNAAKLVTQKISKKLITGIMKKWQANNSSTVVILISGINYGQLRDVRSGLLELRGVTAVNRKGYSNNVAKLEIIFDGTSDSLADRIIDNKTKFKLSIKEAKSNYLHFQRN